MARDARARLGPAGEGHRRDVGVGHHGLADLRAQAVKDVEHTRRKASFLNPRAEKVGRDGGELRGFGHHAVAGRQGWRHFPREQVQRQVPRADASHHPQRLAQGVVDGFPVHGVALARVVLDARGVKPEVLFCAWNVDVAGKGHRLAVVFRLRFCKRGSVPLNGVRQLVQARCPIRHRGGRPTGKRALGCRHGAVHFRGPRPWNGAVHFTCARRHVVQDLGRAREGPVDEILNLHVRRSYLGLHIFAPPKRNAPWCNGNTPVFGTVFPGSSPGGATTKKPPHAGGFFGFWGVRERRSRSI